MIYAPHGMHPTGYRDEGTDHPQSDGHCWWCWLPVLCSVHDFSTCHSEFNRPRRERAEKRRLAKERRMVAVLADDPQEALF